MSFPTSLPPCVASFQDHVKEVIFCIFQEIHGYFFISHLFIYSLTFPILGQYCASKCQSWNLTHVKVDLKFKCLQESCNFRI